MQLRRLRLREVATILIDSQSLLFLKTWALARLMFWIWLDQRPGKREEGAEGKRINRPRFGKRNAVLAGHMTLACFLDGRIKPAAAKRRSPEEMVRLFVKSGGFGVFVDGRRGARSLLSAAKSADQDLKYVYEIVSYLCRSDAHAADAGKTTLTYAKLFVGKRSKTYGLSKINKIWEANKQAAPYTFAFYGHLSGALMNSTSFTALVSALAQLATKQNLMKKLLGEAAYAAAVLDKNAHNVRVKDFRGVKEKKPRLEPFGRDELRLIDSIDADELTERELENYRPESIRPASAQKRRGMPSALGM